MGDFFTLNCPSCGGRLEVDPNTPVMRCPYYGAEHFIHREGGILIIGVEDNGNVFGLESDTSTTEHSRENFLDLLNTLIGVY